MKKRYLTSVLSLMAGLVMIAASLLGPRTALAFTANLVASDPVFDNTATMSAGDIDAFLNKYSSSCISPNNHFQAIDPTGYSPGGGFTYGGNVSAGQVIYDAAQAYGLNPQVLLVTLQKEQSLVTGGAGCSTLQYTGAVGYGCPDSGTTHDYSGLNLYTLNGTTVTSVNGTCVNSASKAGFSQQVIRGAWLLKFGEERSEGKTDWAVVKGNWNNSDDPGTCYGGPMTEGYRKRCSSDQNSVYYDGYTTIDGSSTHMDSGATAALYWYTPHFSGNQHFVTIFESTFGFGSTQDGRLQIRHPDGTLIRAATSPDVYLIEDGKRRFLTSLGVFQSWGFNFNQLKIATNDDLNTLPYGDAMQFREGTLVKGSAPTVYVIDNVSGHNVRRSLVSLDNFQRLDYKPGDIITVPDTELNQTPEGDPYGVDIAIHPDGTLIRPANSPTVYYIINGQAHSMTSANILASHGFSFANVKIATNGDLGQLLSPPSWPITWFREGTIVKGSSPEVFIIDLDSSGVNMNKRSFQTYYTFVGLDYHFFEVRQVNDNELPAANGPAVNP